MDKPGGLEDLPMTCHFLQDFSKQREALMPNDTHLGDDALLPAVYAS